MFIENVESELSHMSEELAIFVEKYSSVRTSLSFFREGNEPGFLSPWWEKDTRGRNLGPLEAGQELAVKAAANLLMTVSCLCQLFITPFESDSEEYHSSKTERCCASLVGLLLYAVSFVADLVLNLAAMITRSLASVVLSLDIALADTVERFVPTL